MYNTAVCTILYTRRPEHWTVVTSSKMQWRNWSGLLLAEDVNDYIVKEVSISSYFWYLELFKIY
jgi:hypothetical protein